MVKYQEVKIETEPFIESQIDNELILYIIFIIPRKKRLKDGLKNIKLSVFGTKR